MAFLNTSREVDQERVAKARIAKISRTIYSKEYKAEAQINAAMLDKHRAGKKRSGNSVTFSWMK